MKKLGKIYTALIFVFLYLPIIVLVVASFNTGKDISGFESFTLRNYSDLFRDSTLLPLLANSLILAVTSSLIATVLGTLAAIGIHSMRGKLRSLVMSVTNLPLMSPEIVTGISLSLLFVFTGRLLLHREDVLGFGTLLIAHVTFNLPYVILSVMPKLSQMDPSLSDAAQDLGCTPAQATFKVVLPEIMPGVISGAMMAFTMSLDDFVISYFTFGPSFATLPVEIYNYTKKPIQPRLYALFTLLFALILAVMILMNVLQARDEKKKRIQNV